jgi:hypothetical protein
VWIQAEDGIGNVSAPYQLPPSTTVTADGTDPVVSGFDVAQSATGYAFAPSASSTVSDNKAGPLKAYLIMAESAMTAAQLAAVNKSSVQSSAKNENVAYATAGANLDVTSLNLSADQYWTNSNAFSNISDATPASLYAHLYVIDANGNDASAAPSNAKTVADRTAPQFSGSNVGLAGVGSDSIKVSWNAGFTDGRGLNSGLVYYSTADPGSNLAAWKASASNSSVAASNLGAAGDKTVGGLAAGTYYAYLSVADAASNVRDVRTSPASVALAAPVTNPAGIPNVIDVNAATTFIYSEYSSELVAHGQYAYFIRDRNTNAVQRYDHRGTRTWSAMSALPVSIPNFSAVAVDPANGELYAFIQQHGVYKWISDGWSPYGAPFTPSVGHCDMVVSGGTVYFAAELVNNAVNVKLFKNDGSQATWTTPVGTAGARSLRKMVAMHGTKVYIGYATAGTPTSTVGMAEYDTATGAFTNRGAISGSAGGYNVTVAASADGAYISFPQNGVGATVYKLSNGAYTLLGTRGFGGWTADRKQLPNVSVDSGGGVYCTGMNGKLYRYDATTQAWLDTLTFTTTPGSANAPDWFYAISPDTNMHHVLYSEGTSSALRHAVMVNRDIPIVTSGGPLRSLTSPTSGRLAAYNGTQYLRNLPNFLIGVPVTDTAATSLTLSFNAGDIHAYGVTEPGWPGRADEPNTQIIHTGTQYTIYNYAIDIVYKNFTNASFTISTRAYVWFFTRTPLAVGQAVLNAA